MGRVVPARVPEAIEAVRRQGKRPIALVANACATGTGLYDDVDALATICHDAGVWLHVDGAHGAAALLSPRYGGLLAGVDRADSLTWDGHKMLRTPVLCTGVLFRERSSIDRLFAQDASYLFQEEMREVDPGQYNFETTKPPLGLRLVLTLAMRGEQGLIEYIERQYGLAHEAWAELRALPDFEVPYEPQSNILCFRYLPCGDRQLELRKMINTEGRFYLSSVKLGEHPYLRAAFMSPATTRATVDDLRGTVERLGARLRS